MAAYPKSLGMLSSNDPPDVAAPNYIIVFLICLLHLHLVYGMYAALVMIILLYAAFQCMMIADLRFFNMPAIPFTKIKVRHLLQPRRH